MRRTELIAAFTAVAAMTFCIGGAERGYQNQSFSTLDNGVSILQMLRQPQYHQQPHYPKPIQPENDLPEPDEMDEWMFPIRPPEPVVIPSEPRIKSREGEKYFVPISLPRLIQA